MSLRGELSFEAQDGRRWRLHMDFNAICHFEDATGESFFGFAASLDGAAVAGRPVAGLLRHMVHAALLGSQPDATLQDAGALLTEDQNLPARLLTAAFPPAEEAGDRASGKRGKKPKAV